jgi:CRP-like cAMP-binding protein
MDIQALNIPQWLKNASETDLQIKQFAQEQYLFRQKLPVTAIFAVLSGRVRLFRDLEDGSSVTLHVARAGETFAEAALFADHYHCHAIAETETQALVIDSSTLLQQLSADPEMSLHLARALAVQVRQLRSQLNLRDIRSAPARVLSWLRLQASGDPLLVEVDRPWIAIASELGLTHEAVYRSLSSLEKQGNIKRSSSPVNHYPVIELC